MNIAAGSIGKYPSQFSLTYLSCIKLHNILNFSRKKLNKLLLIQYKNNNK